MERGQGYRTLNQAYSGIKRWSRHSDRLAGNEGSRDDSSDPESVAVRDRPVGHETFLTC